MNKWGRKRRSLTFFMMTVWAAALLLSGCLGFVSEKPLVTGENAFIPLEGTHGFSIYNTSFIIQQDGWRYTISTLNQKYDLLYAAFRPLSHPTRLLMQVWEQNTAHGLYWYYLLEEQGGGWRILNFNLEKMNAHLKETGRGTGPMIESIDPVLAGNKAVGLDVPVLGVPVEWIGAPPVIKTPAVTAEPIKLKDVLEVARETLDVLTEDDQPDAARKACLELALPVDMAEAFGVEGVDVDALDETRAEPVCREAVQKSPDDVYLHTALGRVLDKARKYDQARIHYEKAAEQGVAFAQDNLGDLYFYGSGMPQDFERAAQWFRAAAEQGYARAQADLGYLYETGKGVPQSYEKAAELYQAAADQGFARAQNNLAYFYEVGHGVVQDYGKAVELNLLAADQGYVRALADLGYLYEIGEGVPQDYQKAAELYLVAAEKGYARGQNNLGNLYFSGKGVPKDYEKAAHWYGKAADQDYAKAQNNLGELYENGQGVPQDYQKAASFYELSADQGYARAQANLAYFYEHGQGVSQDYEKARELYQAAAAQDYSRAQNQLGDFYYYGKGVPQDYEKAVEQYKLAANQGYALAQNNLAHCYRVGRGVPKNLKKAKYYYSLAADQGLEGAKDGLKKVQEELSGG